MSALPMQLIAPDGTALIRCTVWLDVNGNTHGFRPMSKSGGSCSTFTTATFNPSSFNPLSRVRRYCGGELALQYNWMPTGIGLRGSARPSVALNPASSSNPRTSAAKVSASGLPCVHDTRNGPFGPAHAFRNRLWSSAVKLLCDCFLNVANSFLAAARSCSWILACRSISALHLESNVSLSSPSNNVATMIEMSVQNRRFLSFSGNLLSNFRTTATPAAKAAKRNEWSAIQTMMLTI
jgi:hypothetical protein